MTTMHIPGVGSAVGDGLLVETAYNNNKISLYSLKLTPV